MGLVKSDTAQLFVDKAGIPSPLQYVDPKAESMKLGGLFHDAAQITAAIVMGQGLDTDKALRTFDTVLAGIVERRKKLDA